MAWPYNIGLSYWLKTRAGYYDPKLLNRIKNQKAWENYVHECERRYQEYQEKDLVELEKEALRKYEGLRQDLKRFFEENLFKILFNKCGGDLEAVAGILKQKQYQEIIEYYEIRRQLLDQYNAAKRRGASH